MAIRIGFSAFWASLTLGMFSREFVLRWRSQLLSAGYGAKMALGLLFVAIGALVCLGSIKQSRPRSSIRRRSG